MLISGWGVLSEGGSGPDILNVAFVPLITQAFCSYQYREHGPIITDDMVCAGYLNGKRGLRMRNTDDSIALMAPPLFENVELFLLLKVAIAIPKNLLSTDDNDSCPAEYHHRK